jgi:hypothetical protein
MRLMRAAAAIRLLFRAALWHIVLVLLVIGVTWGFLVADLSQE